MATKRAYVEIRTQPARGTFPHRGPDTYVAVQIVPDGVKKLECLNLNAARKRGIEIRYTGEGYHDRSGPRSALGQAIARAHQMVKEINEETAQ